MSALPDTNHRDAQTAEAPTHKPESALRAAFVFGGVEEPVWKAEMRQTAQTGPRLAW